MKKIPFSKRLWFCATIVLLALCIISILTSYNFSTTKVLEKRVVATKIQDFINKYLLESATAKVINVSEEYGLYKLSIDINGRMFSIYSTKDGAVIFPNAIDIRTAPQLEPRTTETQEKFKAPKKDKVNVKFFVMSFCPFGNQAEQGLAPVYKLLGEKVEWEPHYVIYSNYGGYPDYCLDENEKYCSMHGIQELNQNVRELCVWKYYNHSKWWDFVLKINEKCNSRNADTCWQSIAEDIGINVTKISLCEEKEALSLLEKELELNKQYNVRGSPTVFINEKEYYGERTPEAYKQAICSGFIKPLKECNVSLTSNISTTSGSCA